MVRVVLYEGPPAAVNEEPLLQTWIARIQQDTGLLLDDARETALPPLDIAVGISPAWDVNPEYTNELWDTGYSLFTVGDDCRPPLRLIASSEGVRRADGDFVKVLNHPVGAGWDSIPGNSLDDRHRISEVTAGVDIIAADPTGAPGVLALELPSPLGSPWKTQRWVHLQSSQLPPPAFFKSSFRWLAHSFDWTPVILGSLLLGVLWMSKKGQIK